MTRSAYKPNSIQLQLDSTSPHAVPRVHIAGHRDLREYAYTRREYTYTTIRAGVSPYPVTNTSCCGQRSRLRVLGESVQKLCPRDTVVCERLASVAVQGLDQKRDSPRWKLLAMASRSSNDLPAKNEQNCGTSSSCLRQWRPMHLLRERSPQGGTSARVETGACPCPRQTPWGTCDA